MFTDFLFFRQLSDKMTETGFNNAVMMAFAWNVTLAAALSGIAPRAMTIILVIAIALIFATIPKTGCLPFRQKKHRHLVWTTVLFAAYILLHGIWFSYFWNSLFAALSILFLITSSLVVCLTKDSSNKYLYRMTRGILIGLILSLIYLLFEYLTDLSILKTIYTKTGKAVYRATLNQNTALLVLFLWPILLIIQSWKTQLVNRILTTLFLIGIIVILFHTASETAIVAFLFSSTAFIAAYFLPRYTFTLVTVTWIAIVTLIIPLMLFLGSTNLHKNETLGLSARVRIIIWNHTAHKSLENPLFGVGIKRGREFSDTLPKIEVRKGLSYSAKALHPHNMYLQIWHDLGAVGAAFLLAIGLMTLGLIWCLESWPRAYALATFTAFAIIASFGWGMWQTWLLMAYSYSVIFLILAIEFASRHELYKTTQETLTPK